MWYNLPMLKTIDEAALAAVRYDAAGLVAAVCQDVATRAVLMVAWMNAEALHLTLTSGEAWFWSRSRRELWHKGASSGNRLHVRELRLDCDGDTILLLVTPDGPACHTGAVSCFYTKAAQESNE